MQANQLLRNLVPSHPNLAVADWSGFADKHPEMFSTDGLHLKGSGPDLMAFFVADQVARAKAGDGAPKRPRPPAPPTTGTTRHEVARRLSHRSTTGSPPIAVHHGRRMVGGTWAVGAATITLLIAAGMALRRRRSTNVGHVPRPSDQR